MKLQLALDMVDIEGAKAILKEVNGVIDRHCPEVV